jgi:hypothetical protein
MPYLFVMLLLAQINAFAYFQQKQLRHNGRVVLEDLFWAAQAACFPVASRWNGRWITSEG